MIMASNAMRTYRKDESERRSKKVISIKEKHAQIVRNAFDGSRLPCASQSQLQDQFLHSEQTAESASVPRLELSKTKWQGTYQQDAEEDA